jgi:hypothetical protein
MNKRTLIPILLLFALVAIVYAVYKATEPTVTTIETGRSIVYGQPQHGLTLGLGIFAGLCVLGAAILSRDEHYRTAHDGHAATTTTTTSGSKVATNYPR